MIVEEDDHTRAACTNPFEFPEKQG